MKKVHVDHAVQEAISSKCMTWKSSIIILIPINWVHTSKTCLSTCFTCFLNVQLLKKVKKNLTMIFKITFSLSLSKLLSEYFSPIWSCIYLRETEFVYILFCKIYMFIYFEKDSCSPCWTSNPLTSTYSLESKFLVLPDLCASRGLNQDYLNARWIH